MGCEDCELVLVRVVMRFIGKKRGKRSGVDIVESDMNMFQMKSLSGSFGDGVLEHQKRFLTPSVDLL